MTDQLITDLISHIRDISLKTYNSTWYDNIEYQIWFAINNEDSRINNYKLSARERKDLLELKTQLKGWLVYDLYGGVTLLSIDDLKSRINEVYHRRDNWAMKADAVHYTNEWLGAILYFLYMSGKIHFNEIYRKKYQIRNAYIGLSLKMSFLILVLIYSYWIFNSR